MAVPKQSFLDVSRYDWLPGPPGAAPLGAAARPAAPRPSACAADAITSNDEAAKAATLTFAT